MQDKQSAPEAASASSWTIQEEVLNKLIDSAGIPEHLKHNPVCNEVLDIFKDVEYSQDVIRLKESLDKIRSIFSKSENVEYFKYFTDNIRELANRILDLDPNSFSSDELEKIFNSVKNEENIVVLKKALADVGTILSDPKNANLLAQFKEQATALQKKILDIDPYALSSLSPNEMEERKNMKDIQDIFDSVEQVRDLDALKNAFYTITLRLSIPKNKNLYTIFKDQSLNLLDRIVWNNPKTKLKHKDRQHKFIIDKLFVDAKQRRVKA